MVPAVATVLDRREAAHRQSTCGEGVLTRSWRSVRFRVKSARKRENFKKKERISLGLDGKFESCRTRCFVDKSASRSRPLRNAVCRHPVRAYTGAVLDLCRRSRWPPPHPRLRGGFRRRKTSERFRHEGRRRRRVIVIIITCVPCSPEVAAVTSRNGSPPPHNTAVIVVVRFGTCAAHIECSPPSSPDQCFSTLGRGRVSKAPDRIGGSPGRAPIKYQSDGGPHTVSGHRFVTISFENYLLFPHFDKFIFFHTNFLN